MVGLVCPFGARALCMQCCSACCCVYCSVCCSVRCSVCHRVRDIPLAQEPYVCSVAVCIAACVAACVAVCASEFVISLWRKKLYACRALCNTYRCRHTYSLTTYMFTYHIVRATGTACVHAWERALQLTRCLKSCVCVCVWERERERSMQLTRYDVWNPLAIPHEPYRVENESRNPHLDNDDKSHDVWNLVQESPISRRALLPKSPVNLAAQKWRNCTRVGHEPLICRKKTCL